MVAAGMAHDSTGIRHAGPDALHRCFYCDCPDLDTLAIEICPALRVDAVVRRIHM